MNANELADELETGELIEFFEKHTQYWKKSKVIEAITMLRQQQAEIEALKQILAYEGIGVSKEYLDECVAELRKKNK